MTPAIFPERHFFRNDGLRLAFHESGPPSGPALLFLHDTPEIAYSWRRQLPFFANESFRCIAPDLRGHGWSESPRRFEAMGLDAVAFDVVALCEHLEIESVIVIGHGMGVTIAQHLAITHPHLVRGIAAIGAPLRTDRTPPSPVEGSEEAVFASAANDAVANLDANSRDFFGAYLRAGLRSRPNALDVLRNELLGEEMLSARELDAYDEAYSRSGFRAMAWWFRNGPATAARHGELDHAMTMPALWVRGENDPDVSEIDELLEDYTIAELETGGPFLPQEAPTLVNHVLLQWLTEKF